MEIRLKSNEQNNKASIRLICLLLSLSILFSFNCISPATQTLDPFSIKAPAPIDYPAIESQAVVKFVSRSYKNLQIPTSFTDNEDPPPQWAAIFVQNHLLDIKPILIVDSAYTSQNITAPLTRNSYPRAPPVFPA